MSDIHELITADSQKHMPYGYSTQLLWDESRIRVAKGTLTPAQILAIHTTAVDVIDSPGVGKMVIPIRLLAWLDFNTTAYSTAPATVINLQNTSIAYGLQIAASLINQTVDYANQDLANSLITALSNFENLKLSFLATGAITLGDSPINYWIDYRIYDL
jgi:hypothetical protein